MSRSHQKPSVNFEFLDPSWLGRLRPRPSIERGPGSGNIKSEVSDVPEDPTGLPAEVLIKGQPRLAAGWGELGIALRVSLSGRLDESSAIELEGLLYGVAGPTIMDEC